MPSETDDEGKYQYPPPPRPLLLFPNLNGISVRRGSAKFSFHSMHFFSIKTYKHLKKGKW